MTPNTGITVSLIMAIISIVIEHIFDYFY